MLRQRTWAIFIRPYYMLNGRIRIDYLGAPKAADSDVGTPQPRGYAVTLRGNGEGGSDSTAEIEVGGWTMWYISTSFDQIRDKYKDILKETSKENIRIVEMLPTDMIITPYN